MYNNPAPSYCGAETPRDMPLACLQQGYKLCAHAASKVREAGGRDKAMEGREATG